MARPVCGYAVVLAVRIATSAHRDDVVDGVRLTDAHAGVPELALAQVAFEASSAKALPPRAGVVNGVVVR